MFFPGILIAIGVLFLLRNLNLIPDINWDLVWPVLIILLGLSMLKGKMGDGCCNWFMGKKDNEMEKK